MRSAVRTRHRLSPSQAVHQPRCYKTGMRATPKRNAVRFATLAIVTLVGVAYLVMVLLKFGMPAVREREFLRDKLEPLLRQRVSAAEVQAVLGPSRPMESGEARRWAKTLALDCQRTLDLISTHPTVHLHTVSANVTCFVFYDEQGRFIAYELGAQ